MSDSTDKDFSVSFFSLNQSSEQNLQNEFNIKVLTDFSEISKISDFSDFFSYDAFILKNLSEIEKRDFYSFFKKKTNTNTLTGMCAFLTSENVPFFIYPCGPDIPDENDILNNIEQVKKIVSSFDAPFDIGILSGGRSSDIGRSPVVDETIRRAEVLEQKLNQKGYNAVNHTILIEDAVGVSNVIIAPDILSAKFIAKTVCGVGTGFEVCTILFSDNPKAPPVFENITRNVDFDFFNKFVYRILKRN